MLKSPKKSEFDPKQKLDETGSEFEFRLTRVQDKRRDTFA